MTRSWVSFTCAFWKYVSSWNLLHDSRSPTQLVHLICFIRIHSSIFLDSHLVPPPYPPQFPIPVPVFYVLISPSYLARQTGADKPSVKGWQFVRFKYSHSDTQATRGEAGRENAKTTREWDRVLAYQRVLRLRLLLERLKGKLRRSFKGNMQKTGAQAILSKKKQKKPKNKNKKKPIKDEKHRETDQ